jgi:hypothetical protein
MVPSDVAWALTASPVAEGTGAGGAAPPEEPESLQPAAANASAATAAASIPTPPPGGRLRSGSLDVIIVDSPPAEWRGLRCHNHHAAACGRQPGQLPAQAHAIGHFTLPASASPRNVDVVIVSA